MESKIIELFEEEFMPMTAERDKQWFGVFKAGYQAALSAVPAQNNLPPDWEKNVSRMWQCVRKHDCDIPSDDLDLMRQILLQSQVQQDHIGDSTKLVQAVNALAAQTGESAESITEWLTDKGGLTTLMLSHFGAMNKQSEKIAKDAIQHGTGIGLFVDGKLQHIKQEDFYLSADEIKAQQPAQEPVKQESKPSIEDVQNLVDASESIKKWLVKNVHQWNFSAYDRLHLATMRVKESMPPVKEVTE
jgi:hypothetical protein